MEQVKPGGIIVIPIGAGKDQEMIRIKKDLEGNLVQDKLGVFSFVTMLKETDK